MIILFLVSLGVSVFCFSKYYIFIGIICLWCPCALRTGWIALIITSVFLLSKGHLVAGTIPLLWFVYDFIILHLPLNDKWKKRLGVRIRFK
jgi:hypothetical protein